MAIPPAEVGGEIAVANFSPELNSMNQSGFVDSNLEFTPELGRCFRPGSVGRNCQWPTSVEPVHVEGSGSDSRLEADDIQGQVINREVETQRHPVEERGRNNS